jgi:hypothetical protein
MINICTWSTILHNEYKKYHNINRDSGNHNTKKYAPVIAFPRATTRPAPACPNEWCGCYYFMGWGCVRWGQL